MHSRGVGQNHSLYQQGESSFTAATGQEDVLPEGWEKRVNTLGAGYYYRAPLKISPIFDFLSNPIYGVLRYRQGPPKTRIFDE